MAQTLSKKEERRRRRNVRSIKLESFSFHTPYFHVEDAKTKRKQPQNNLFNHYN
jgi:hypothetical protein